MLGEEPTEEPLSVAARNFPRPRCVSLFVNGINANFKLELLQAPLQRMHLDATLNCFLLYSATECASSSDLMPPTFVRTLTMSRFSTSGSSCWSQNVEILPISSIDSDLQLSYFLPATELRDVDVQLKDEEVHYPFRDTYRGNALSST